MRQKGEIQRRVALGLSTFDRIDKLIISTTSSASSLAVLQRVIVSLSTVPTRYYALLLNENVYFFKHVSARDPQYLATTPGQPQTVHNT